MFIQNFALLAASVSALFASTSFALPQQACNGCEAKYEDVDAMKELTRIYGNKQELIPASLKKSIGSCKFTAKTSYSFAYGGQPKVDGKPSGKIIAKGTANPADTCIYYTGNFFFSFSIFIEFR